VVKSGDGLTFKLVFRDTSRGCREGQGGMKFGRGIGTKTFAGFIALIAISVISGGAGYFTLDKVKSTGGLDIVTNDLQSKVFAARVYEKDYIIAKNDKNFSKLTKALDELRGLTNALRAATSDARSAEEM
jgi:CHASE3 domain sensor protein